MEEIDGYFDKIVCEVCGHVACRLCEWEDEEGRVWDWWDGVDY
jgi:hypothetical protein